MQIGPARADLPRPGRAARARPRTREEPALSTDEKALRGSVQSSEDLELGSVQSSEDLELGSVQSSEDLELGSVQSSEDHRSQKASFFNRAFLRFSRTIQPTSGSGLASRAKNSGSPSSGRAATATDQP